MRLEEYWGVGPKTRATLESSVGTAAAIEAIESGDLRTLVEAGVDRGRATRILRRSQDQVGMDLLATRDARAVYTDLLDLAVEHAVSDEAAARVRLLTPLSQAEARIERLDAVDRARETWRDLDDGTREAVLEAFEEYDRRGGSELAAVETALALHEAGATEGAFSPVGELDPDALADAAAALGALEGDRVVEGADDDLDRMRRGRAAVDDLAADVEGLVEDLRSAGVRDTAGFRDGLADRLREQTDVDAARVRDAMAGEATDATAFVGETLRALRADLDRAIDERTEELRADLEADLEAAREDVDAAGTAAERVARDCSLARFAEAYDLVRPEYVDAADGGSDGSDSEGSGAELTGSGPRSGQGAVAIAGGRNLLLAAEGIDVQPITYALGDHDLDAPVGQQVSVLTGANSGGKTTLLETLCQVAILAHMGLPVPADRAQVSEFDRIVFHRRHASFNAGVLESTLRNVVPPLTRGERTLMLVDEFEAITEPGSAANLLHGLVRLTVDEGAMGTFVTHLAEDLEPLPETARVDGIFAEGLTADLELQVDYQPRFDELGRSTPEFIVSRLLADSDDHAERSGFETLAEAVGTEVVQRTLADARWSE